jgi:hypothetical protein
VSGELVGTSHDSRAVNAMFNVKLVENTRHVGLPSLQPNIPNTAIGVSSWVEANARACRSAEWRTSDFAARWRGLCTASTLLGLHRFS